MSESPQAAIIMLAGPIKHWWDANWDTSEHWEYAAWRDAVNDGLVDADYLVYRPHEAFKGAWTERAQSVNDLVLRLSDVVVNLTPPGIPSLGTDGEMLYSLSNGRAKHLSAPPTTDVEQGVHDVVDRIADLGVGKASVGQEIIIDSFGINADRAWLLRSAASHYAGQILRLHYEDRTEGIAVIDAQHIELPELADIIQITTTRNAQTHIPFNATHKLEVLARAAA